MTFYYCNRCKKFYNISNISFDVITKNKLCLTCYSGDVIEYKNKTFQEMANIERLLKINKLKGNL